MRRVLWWLIGGTRGGRNRLRIVRTIQETPMNANQLADALDLNYKTVQHHLELLLENDVVMTMGGGYGATYFLSDPMESNLDVLDEVAAKADLDDVARAQDAEDPGDDADGPSDDAADRGPGEADAGRRGTADIVEEDGEQAADSNQEADDS